MLAGINETLRYWDVSAQGTRKFETFRADFLKKFTGYGYVL